MRAVRVRPAEPADVDAILRLLHALADYERSADQLLMTATQLSRALFTETPAAACHVAELDGGLVGVALWYPTFSTWTGEPGIHLEDLIVVPAARSRGIGRLLLQTLAAVAVTRGWGRLEWNVLDWNAPAIGFYRALGATPMDEWTTWRVAGDTLRALGAPAD